MCKELLKDGKVKVKQLYKKNSLEIQTESLEEKSQLAFENMKKCLHIIREIQVKATQIYDFLSIRPQKSKCLIISLQQACEKTSTHVDGNTK